MTRLKKTVKIRGQQTYLLVTIPKAIEQLMDVKKGEYLDVIYEDGKVYLQKTSNEEQPTEGVPIK